MQVSWIDQNEVASLLADLASPPPAPDKAPETAPSVPPNMEDRAGWDGWISDFTAPQPGPLEISPVWEPESGDTSTQPAAAPASSEKEIDAIRERLRVIREQAVTAGLMRGLGVAAAAADSKIEEPARAPAGPAAHETEEWVTGDLFFDPQSSLGGRLEAFADWARERLGGADILVVDEHGDLLWGPPNAAGLVLSTLMALNSARRDSAEAFSGQSGLMTREIAPGRLLTLVSCPTRLGFLQAAIVQNSPLAEKSAAFLRTGLAQVVEAGCVD